MPDLAKLMAGDERKLALRMGQVSTLQTGTITIYLGPDTSTIAEVPYLSSYQPAVNDICWLLQNGTDLIAIGKISGDTASLTTYPGSITAGGTIVADRFKVSPDDLDDSKIDLYGGSYLIGIRASTLYFKAGGTKFYFETPPGSWAMNYGPTEVNGGTERGLLVSGNLETAEIYSNSWFRQNGSGRGYYHQTGGGGWFMQDTTYFRIYGDKQIYTNNMIRGQNAGVMAWQRDGAYACFGEYTWNQAGGNGLGYAAGYMQHSNGNCLISVSDNLRVRRDVGAGDLTLFQVIQSGSASAMYAPLPTNLCGTAMQYASGSQQIGACTSSIRWKKNVRDLPGEYAGANNPMFRLRVVKFDWKEDEDYIAEGIHPNGNGAEVNIWRPTGTTGMIAEEMYEVASDTVAYEGDGAPLAPDLYVMFGYLVDAVQYLKRENDELRLMVGSN